MSAFAAVCYDDRVELATDGAVYRLDGVLTAVREKVFRSERLPMAVTGRGPSGFLDNMAAAILFMAHCGSFDVAMSRLASMLRTKSVDDAAQGGEILIAGISEEQGPCLRYFTTFQDEGRPEPLVLVDPGTDVFAASTLVSRDDLGIVDAARLPPFIDMARAAFELSRRMPDSNPSVPGSPEVYGIGGHIDHTIVSIEGVTTRRAHTWPDVIGEAIDPSRVA